MIYIRIKHKRNSPKHYALFIYVQLFMRHERNDCNANESSNKFWSVALDSAHDKNDV